MNNIRLLAFAISTLLTGAIQGSEPGVVGAGAEQYATAEALGLMHGFPPPPDKRVDRSNAIIGVPHNRWSYQNMRRIYPSASVRAAKQPIHLVRDIDSAIAELSVKREDGSEADLVTRWVPELSESGAFEGATVGQVLNMTNSMAFSEDYHDPESSIQQYGRVLGLFDERGGEQLPGNLYDYLVTLQKGSRDHGAQYEYQTPKADVVNWVTNRVTGLSFEEDLANRLWTHLGTDGETYVLLDKNGNPFAGGGLNASPNNLARFAAMVLNNGRIGDRQLIPIEVLKTIQAGASKTQFSKSIDAQGTFADGLGVIGLNGGFVRHRVKKAPTHWA